ncbi:MAG: hypothetical protein AAB739_02620 [Patescibacteria group bacterium]
MPPETPKDTDDDFFLCRAGKDGAPPTVEKGRKALGNLPPDQKIIELIVVQTGRGTREFFPMERTAAECLQGTFTLGDWFNQSQQAKFAKTSIL